MQSQAITPDTIKVSGIPFLKTLLDVQINITPNEHGKMLITGYGDPAESLPSIEKKFFGQTAELTYEENLDKPIFSGIITKCQVVAEREVKVLEVTVLTGSYLLDTKRISRSFQDVSMTYEDLVRKVLSDTNGAGIFSVGKDVPIGSPIIQYLETDWEFIKRLASHFNSPVIADPTVPKANIWFGINENGKDVTFENENLHYKIGVSENYYKEDGMSSGLTPVDFVYFTLKSMYDYNIGDKAELNGASLKICEKHACFERAMLEFTYTLGKPGLISTRTMYNEKTIGMSLTGKVTETAGETVNIRLDIDGDDGSADYPYHWTPTSGNLMYAMPRIGTQVSLLLPNEDERCAMATNSPRDEETSSTCPEMEDYNYRIFTTEHNKRMLLFPDRMGLVGTGKSNEDSGNDEGEGEAPPKPLWIKLIDSENMHFKSHNTLIILAEGGIELNAPEIIFLVPEPQKIINVMRTPQAEDYAPFIIAVGTASNLPFGSNDDEGYYDAYDEESNNEDSSNEDDEYPTPVDYTFLVLHSRFDITGDRGIFQGRAYQPHQRFEDEPQKGEFSVRRSFVRALVVGVVIAAVAVAVVLTGGAALVAVGLVAKKTVVVAGVTKSVMVGTGLAKAGAMAAAISAIGVFVQDVRSGNNSSWSDFVRSVSIGALLGIISGGILGKFAGIKQAKLSALNQKKLSFAQNLKHNFVAYTTSGLATGAASSLANSAWDRDLFSRDALDRLWRDTLRGGVIGGATSIFGGSLMDTKLRACPKTPLRLFGRQFGNTSTQILKRTWNAGLGGLSNVVTGGLADSMVGMGSLFWNAIQTGDQINWHSAGRGTVTDFKDGAIVNAISGMAEGAMYGEPVNGVHGFVQYQSTAFEYPGMIPLVWKRSWCSRNVSQSPGHFGYGSGFIYGVHLIHDKEHILFIDSNSFGTPFKYIQSNETCTNRKAKMTLSYDGEKYETFNYNERLYHTFEKKPNTNIYHLTQIETETREHKITLKYDSQHNLSSITDTAGRVFIVTTTDTGQITQVQFNGRVLVKYVYSEANDLIQVTNTHGKSSYLNYDGSHLLIHRKTAENANFKWEYIGEGHNAKCIHTTGDDHLLEYWFDYHPDHTIVTDSLGHTEILHLTKDMTLEKVTHKNGHATIYEHNDYDEIISITNADGETVKMSYNQFGQPTEITPPNGATYKVEYDEQGRVVKTINPLSLESAWAYDEIGRVSKSISPTGDTTIYTYDNHGLLTELTTKEGEAQLKTTLQYDDTLNITQISYANGAVETMEYDIEGNCIKATNPLGAVETMSYDQGNRLVRYTSDDGNTTNLKYNAYDNITWMKDNEHEIRFTYSPLGKLTSRIEQHRRIKLQYDTESRLTHVFNESEEEYSYELDPMGRVSIETGYDGVRKLYAYTPAGKLKGMQRGNTANWTRMKYDKNGFLSKIIYDDGIALVKNPEEETFTYGMMGELLIAENKYSKLEFEYDKLGNLVKEIQNGHVVESAYSKDHAFTRTNLKTSLGLNVDTTLNKFGQAENISASFNPNAENNLSNPLSATNMAIGATWQASQTYNMVGQLLERTIATVAGTGMTGATTLASHGETEIKDSWSYDRQGRPTQQKVSINQLENSKRQYTWGIGSKLKSIIDDVANMGLEYSYDNFGNPQKEILKGAKTQETIRYLDDVGQVYETRSKIDRKYGKGGQLMVSKHRKYKYNDCGDLIEKVEADGKTWQYEYNVNGLMKSVIRPDDKLVSFTYDAMARRISKTFDGTTTRYVWDGNQILHEWIEESIVPEASPTVTPISTWLFENGSFTPIAKLTETNAYIIIADHLGTPTKMLDATGKNAWGETFNIWGRRHNETETKTIGNTKIIKAKFKSDEPEPFNPEVDNPFRFPGQYEDIETGLYYNRFRYYMPDEGMYTQHDPIGLVGGNPTIYGYVYNTIMGIDPDGLSQTYWLEKALTDAQRPLGQGQTAHHIVQMNRETRYANLSRGLLDTLGISIDDAANGARLWGTAHTQRALTNHPGRDTARTAGNYHAGEHIHSPTYDKVVYRRLRDAVRTVATNGGSRRDMTAAVKTALNNIGQLMESGSWRQEYETARDSYNE